jgi:hypothetical protein
MPYIDMNKLSVSIIIRSLIYKLKWTSNNNFVIDYSSNPIKFTVIYHNTSAILIMYYTVIKIITILLMQLFF